LRKSMIAAAAATAVLGGAAVAHAAIPADDASMKVTFAPQKAGTAKKPANSSQHLVITNKNVHRTLSQLQFQYPKTIKMSGKGLKHCNKTQLEATANGAICPSGSKAGVGTATAYQGVAEPQPIKRTFNVTAYIVGDNGIDFLIKSTPKDAATGFNISAVSPGTVKQTKKGPRLTIKVPEVAQQVLGTYNGLGKLDVTIDKQSGKHKLIATTGCKKHKHVVTGKLTFIDNGTTEGGTLPLSSAAKCR
jgi:hypothetical protein